MTNSADNLETYALMARCLRDEATEPDRNKLYDLLKAHPRLKNEYEIFRQLLKQSNGERPDKQEGDDLQKKFDEITQRLKQRP